VRIRAYFADVGVIARDGLWIRHECASATG
jgi:hypothetical protein